jgi:pyrimidine deaminase RibD-like protein
MALLIRTKGGSLSPEETLIHQLASSMVGEFPNAMDSPLVAAGIYGTNTQRFYSVGKNVMRLRPVGGYDTIHAEEEAFGELSRRAELSPDEPVCIVVTLEPCRDRKPKGETPCCERIVTFANQHPVDKVIVGTIETGKGLRYLLERGLKVVLLHGLAHKTAIREKLSMGGRGDPNPNLVELMRMKRTLLQVREDAQFDAISQEEHRRFLLAAQQRKTQAEEFFETLKVARNEDALFSKLSALFLLY